MLRMVVMGAAVAAGPAVAQGYADHPATGIFRDAPCGEVLAVLDESEPPAIGNDLSPDGMQAYADALAVQLGGMGTTWGFILGYDAASGGLHKGEASTLMRLRADCEASPDRTALDILEGLAAD